MREHNYYVYILTNKDFGATNDVERRVAEHKWGEVSGFTRRYQLNRLVWFEDFRDIDAAIAKEKRLKGWVRSRKSALIEKNNPRWFNLSADWVQQPTIDRGWVSLEEMVRDPSPAAAGSG